MTEDIARVVSGLRLKEKIPLEEIPVRVLEFWRACPPHLWQVAVGLWAAC